MLKGLNKSIEANKLKNKSEQKLQQLNIGKYICPRRMFRNINSLEMNNFTEQMGQSYVKKPGENQMIPAIFCTVYWMTAPCVTDAPLQDAKFVREINKHVQKSGSQPFC